LKPVRIITLLFFIFILFVIFTADTGILPRLITFMYAFPNGDKVGHFFLLGFLAFLVNLSLEGKTVGILAMHIQLGSLLVAGLSNVEEFSQSFFPARSASLLDLIASLIGIAFFTGLSKFILQKMDKRKSQHPIL
jgi:polysaccharide biosynthesis protein VpsQ